MPERFPANDMAPVAEPLELVKPDQIIGPDSMPPRPGEQGFQYLASKGLEELADITFEDHEGNSMPLTVGIEKCPHLRPLIENGMNIAENMGADKQAIIRQLLPSKPAEDARPATSTERPPKELATKGDTETKPDKPQPTVKSLDVEVARNSAATPVPPERSLDRDPPLANSQSTNNALRFNVQQIQQNRQEQVMLQQAIEQSGTTTTMVKEKIEATVTPVTMPLPKPKVESLHQTDSKIVEFTLEPEPAATSEVDAMEPVAEQSILSLPDVFLMTEPEEQIVTTDAKTEVIEPFTQMIDETEYTGVSSTEILIKKVTDVIELPEETVVQTQNFVENFPPEMTSYVELYLETATPEEAVTVAEAIVYLSVIADRLNVLYQEDKLEGLEAEQIEAIVYEQFEQLLIKIGQPPEEEIIRSFMACIKSDEYQGDKAVVESEIRDVMHERMLALLSKSNDSFKLIDILRSRALAAYLLRLSSAT